MLNLYDFVQVFVFLNAHLYMYTCINIDNIKQKTNVLSFDFIFAGIMEL